MQKYYWLFCAFMTFSCWGFFMPTLATASNIYGGRFLMFNGGFMFLSGLLFTCWNQAHGNSLPLSFSELRYAIIAGIASAIGYVFFALGLQACTKTKAPVNVFVSITSAYVLAAVVANRFLLGEAITLPKFCGIILIVAGTAILFLFK